MDEFRNSNQLWISFPQQSGVTDWRGTLNGSEVVSPAFANCVRTIGG
jgi:hypothetical protein